MKETLFACYPGRSFPSFSVTGKECQLGCDHCQGRHLYWMRELKSPHQLWEEAKRLKESGGTGMLISGGCDSEGHIDLVPYVDVIREIRRQLGLLVNLHAGKVSPEEAVVLASSEADVFSLDLHQDELVIEGPLHRPGGKAVYISSMDALLSAEAEVVPHITVGLSKQDAVLSVEALADKRFRKVVVLVLIPTPGTPISALPMPEDEDVLVILDMLNAMGIEPIMGCMRPRGNHQLEIECLKRGVRTIALPSRKTVEWARNNGFDIEDVPLCCALSDKWPPLPV